MKNTNESNDFLRRIKLCIYTCVKRVNLLFAFSDTFTRVITRPTTLYSTSDVVSSPASSHGVFLSRLIRPTCSAGVTITLTGSRTDVCGVVWRASPSPCSHPSSCWAYFHHYRSCFSFPSGRSTRRRSVCMAMINQIRSGGCSLEII